MCVTCFFYNIYSSKQLLSLLWLIGVACSSLSAIWVKSEEDGGEILLIYANEPTHQDSGAKCVWAQAIIDKVHVRRILCCKRLSLGISRHQPNRPCCILPRLGSAWLSLPEIQCCCCNQLSFWHITEALVNMDNPINVFSNYIMTRA